MEKYESPVVLVNEELAEGVYAASGGTGNTGGATCYTTTARIHQVPENGRNDYRIQVDAHHDADHNSNGQILTLSFNQAVTYVSSNGQLVSGDGTDTIKIQYGYWNNHTDNIGLGDVVVKAGPGLAITGQVTNDEGHRQ